MNDPNGPFQLGGEYHLFYQHNPSGTEWGDIHWGHAKSPDLVNWLRLPVALAPSRELGEHHCFSGCSVVNGEEVTLFYTSIGQGERNATTGAQQWTAKGKDLQTWRKPDFNPVLTLDVHGDLRITEWRDPYVWKEQDEWKMLLGGIYEGKGCALLYHSADLEDWRFERIFHRGDEPIWECPHLFRFGDRAVLFYSPSGPVQYVSGMWNEDGLSEVSWRGTVDYGGWEGYYASTGFVDQKGRRILLGWMPEGRGEGFPIRLDWSGALALPRIVDLKPNGALAISPIPELDMLRGKSASFADFRVGPVPWDTGVFSSSFECAMEIEKPSDENGELIVSLFVSACGRERTDLRLDFATNTIVIDRSKSSLFPGVHTFPVIGKLNPEDAEKTLKLRIFADQSSIEVFAGDETCITARVYPSLDESKGIQLRSNGEIHVIGIELWEMKAADIR
jgi:beta-fructofuranosidase